MNNIFRLVISVAACETAGFIGAIFTTPAIPVWYATLNKPVFSPPNSVFFPVWTILYLLMGISLFLVWKKKIPEKKHIKSKAVRAFFGQLFFNTVWSFAFFGLQSPFAGLVIIIILWILILLTIIRFAKIDKTASYLLYPYIAWVSFAAILNLSIFLLNR